MDFDHERLTEVVKHLLQLCEEAAARGGGEFRLQYLAERVFAHRTGSHSRKVGLTQLLRHKCPGHQQITASDIELLFRGIRRTIHEYSGGSPNDAQVNSVARDAELDTLTTFGIDDPDGQLRPSHFVVHTDLTDQRTPALASHDPVRMARFARKCRTVANKSPSDAFARMCKDAGAELVTERPDSADLSRVRVLAASTLFDNRDWERIPHGSLRTLPVQACYCTSVLRVLVEDPEARAVAFEFNTSGFGVFPVPCEDPTAPPYRFLIQDNVRMTESPTPTRTSYVEFALDQAGVHREQTFIIHSVFFNGVQDQYELISDAAEPAEIDWHGKRVYPETEDADLTVILPARYPIEYHQFARRPESASRDILAEADQRERIFEPAQRRTGSILEGIKAIWKIPRVTEPTVFSFQWRWQ